MQKHRFNIFPEMQPEDFDRLHNDLLTNGYDKRQPIYTYQGCILDGWNRQLVCDSIGITPTYEAFYGSDSDALEFVFRTNKRRNLTGGQWACIVAESEDIVNLIKEETEKERRKKISDTMKSDNKMAQKVAPSDKSEREFRTKAAKAFNTNRTYVNDAIKLRKENPDLFEQVKSGDLHIKKAYKEIKENEILKQRKQQADEGRHKVTDVDLRLGDFEEVFKDIPDNSIDCIITDPPYPYEFIDCWSKLSRFSKRVLKKNGYCIAYSGQFHLPEVIRRMSEHLDYYWTFCVYLEGLTQIVNAVNINCRWKPILIYQKGKEKNKKVIQDYFISEKREKDSHTWQQSQSGIRYLVDMFTSPGDIVLDPFAGSGTTLIVAKEMNRVVMGAEIDETTYNIAKSKL